MTYNIGFHAIKCAVKPFDAAGHVVLEYGLDHSDIATTRLLTRSSECFPDLNYLDMLLALRR